MEWWSVRNRAEIRGKPTHARQRVAQCPWQPLTRAFATRRVTPPNGVCAPRPNRRTIFDNRRGKVMLPSPRRQPQPAEKIAGARAALFEWQAGKNRHQAHAE